MLELKWSQVSKQFFLLLLQNFPIVSSNRHPWIQHQHYLIPNSKQCLLYLLQILLIHLSLLHQDHEYKQTKNYSKRKEIKQLYIYIYIYIYEMVKGWDWSGFMGGSKFKSQWGPKKERKKNLPIVVKMLLLSSAILSKDLTKFRYINKTYCHI